MHDHIPVTPGAIIGHRADGRPIWLIAGGSEPVPPAPANGATDPAAPPAPSAEPSAQPPAPDPAANAGQPGGDGVPPAGAPAVTAVDQLPDWTQKLVRDLRSENAATRTKAKELTDALAASEAKHNQAMDGIAKALGLKPDEATPEQLAAARDAAVSALDAEKGVARAARVELAAYRAAALAGADPARLLDSRTFVSTLDGLDPTGDGFDQVVRDKVAAALEANPSLKLGSPPAPAAPGAPVPQPPAAPPLPAPPVPASGPQGSPGPPPAGSRQLTEADAKNMTPQQVVDAMNNGAFSAEGFGASRRQGR